MLKRVYEYIKDDEFRFTIYDDRIHIVNYKKIGTLNSDYVSIESNDHKINIKGNKLILNRLFEKEVLIIGEVKTIEVING